MKVILTGSTGMIGEGVLLECLASEAVSQVLSVSRKPCGIKHPKLQEYLVPDFLSLPENDPRLQHYDTCFFCAGISSIGKTEEEYRRNTYDTTLAFARAFGPGPEKTFVYVSGSGTDSSEKGRLMWARVKGKTENDLSALPFRQTFGYRIVFVKPTEGQKRTLSLYKYLSWMFPLIRRLFPATYCTMAEVAHSMMYVAKHAYEKKVMLVKDITQTARLQRQSEA